MRDLPIEAPTKSDKLALIDDLIEMLMVLRHEFLPPRRRPTKKDQAEVLAKRAAWRALRKAELKEDAARATEEYTIIREILIEAGIRP